MEDTEEDFDDDRVRGDDFSGRVDESEEDSTREPSRKFREAVVKVLSAMTAEPRPLRSKFGTTAVCSSADAKRRKVFRVLFSRTFEYVLLKVVLPALCGAVDAVGGERRNGCGREWHE